MTCTFGQVSIILEDVQQSGHPFFWDGSTHSHCHTGLVCHFCLKLLHSYQQHPEYLYMKTCQLISLSFAMFGWSAKNHIQLLFLVLWIFEVAFVYIHSNFLLHMLVESGLGILEIMAVNFCNTQSYFIM